MSGTQDAKGPWPSAKMWCVGEEETGNHSLLFKATSGLTWALLPNFVKQNAILALIENVWVYRRTGDSWHSTPVIHLHRPPCQRHWIQLFESALGWNPISEWRWHTEPEQHVNWYRNTRKCAGAYFKPDIWCPSNTVQNLTTKTLLTDPIHNGELRLEFACIYVGHNRF